MGTPGAGRKRTPIKDRFSAEDEALSHIAREAEARLAAKRAARAEARDIRMKELERQQKEFHRPSGSKWGEIHQWMENTERAKHSHKSGRYHLHTSSDLGGSYRSSSRRKDYVSSDVKDKSSQFKKLSQANSVYSDRLAAKKTLSSSNKDLLSGMYYDQRNYSTLRNSKLHSYSRPSSLYSDPIATTKSYRPYSLYSDPIATTKSYRPSSLYSDPIGTTKSYRPSSLYSDPVATTSYRASSNLGTGLYRSQSLASLRDTGLYHRDPKYSSRTPSEYSYSFRSSSARSSPLNSDDETLSTVSQDGLSRGRRDSVSSDFSDQSESIADYFSRSNRRGSVVSDLDDSTVPDLFILEEKTESFSRPASRNAVAGLSPATLASLGGSSSRRGSGDSSSVLDPDVSLSELRDIYDLKDQIQDVEGRYMQGLKELKDSLSEVEEKYKKAMVSNAQLDNEKSNLIYQVDTLKDVIEELEEQMSELYRENVEKSKELERQKHMCIVSQHKAEELKEGIRQRDELIEKHGLVIIPEGTPNGDINHEPIVGAITVVSQEAAQVLEGAGDGPLDVRLKKLAEEKEELLGQIRKLKFQVEEERQKNSKIENVLTDSDRLENGTDLQILEMQRDINRQLSEYKFKLSKAEQDNATLEQNVSRLEGQVLRYKSSAENSEKIEDELKAEKRRLQRELRSAMDKTEEMEMTNSHLVKRLEKMKANRNALLSQQ
ncbi:leucine-rich repeat flightless-interacting protein 2 isoform X8 [Callorhinchus milii]|uniref:leucine-rich repeat flightless-interacting protein 2 isoform X8 n=1 Tax=Callorhinchus milii TaxID=7868 RepID=UPI001C3FC6BF|nr:leucine-rich repeat flightless-interacting protein 2 isoform X8 [Callorhinchus milii]